MTPEYEAALNTANAASVAYHAVAAAHMKGEVSDAEYLVARAAHVAACKVFDAAFDKEAALGAE